MLLKGYTYPPGTDPISLEQRLNTWTPTGYYGHYPAAVIGMTAYYYLTPLLTYLGLRALLIPYGKVAVYLGWASLWLVARALHFDLHLGTFVGVIGFYGLGLAFLRMLAKGYPQWVVLSVAAVVVPFHAFSGLLIMGATGMHGVILRRWLSVVAGILGAIGTAYSWLVLKSSVSQLSRLPNAVQGQAITDYPMTVTSFFAEFVGMPTLVLWCLGLICAAQAWQTGWRPRKDHALLVLALLTPVLLVFTFSPLAINADRTAKTLIGVLCIFSVVGIVDGLRHLQNKKATLVVGASLAAILAASYQIWPYWLQSGSYR